MRINEIRSTRRIILVLAALVALALPTAGWAAEEPPGLAEPNPENPPFVHQMKQERLERWRDRREDRLDRLEDRRDRREDFFDRREDIRDRREDFFDQRDDPITIHPAIACQCGGQAFLKVQERLSAPVSAY